MVLSQKIKKNQGFTLLEVLIALFIFVLGSVSIWSLFAVAINTYNESVDNQIAALVAESIVAELKDVDIVKNKPLPTNSEGKSIHFPNYEYEIKYFDIEHDAVLIKIKIFYMRRGNRQELQFCTVLYKN